MSDFIPEETVRSRMNDLGWTEADARSIPIRVKGDGNSIASKARDAGVSAARVQREVRAGYDVDDAIAIAAVAEGNASF